MTRNGVPSGSLPERLPWRYYLDEESLRDIKEHRIVADGISFMDCADRQDMLKPTFFCPLFIDNTVVTSMNMPTAVFIRQYPFMPNNRLHPLERCHEDEDYVHDVEPKPNMDTEMAMFLSPPRLHPWTIVRRNPHRLTRVINLAMPEFDSDSEDDDDDDYNGIIHNNNIGTLAANFLPHLPSEAFGTQDPTTHHYVRFIDGPLFVPTRLLQRRNLDYDMNNFRNFLNRGNDAAFIPPYTIGGGHDDDDDGSEENDVLDTMVRNLLPPSDREDNVPIFLPVTTGDHEFDWQNLWQTIKHTEFLETTALERSTRPTNNNWAEIVKLNIFHCYLMNHPTIVNETIPDFEEEDEDYVPGMELDDYLYEAPDTDDYLQPERFSTCVENTLQQLNDID